jgi:signal transduction histidine kinase
MPSLSTAIEAPTSDVPARLRAKERLYVILQAASWGSFIVIQIVFSRLGTADPLVRERAIPAIIQVLAAGLLISHYGRFVIHRLGWKELGWKALAPRILLFAAAQALVWCTLLFLFQTVFLGWNDKRLSLPVMFIGAWINCTVIMVGWLAVYFFYHLFDRFNRTEIERLRLAASVKQAELRALKSQLNPHFIFNSLNSLRALIDEDPARARQSVTQLANLLRYSLQAGQQELAPLEEELRVVKDYLSLEQVRHEERLRFRFDVDDGALPWPVPPMLLQTLVENAVKYGISNRADGGEIRISARIHSDQLVLRVTNPGRVTTSLRNKSSTGLGLSNAAERLKLLLGDRSSLSLREEGDDSVAAEAVIPRLGAGER